MDRTQETIGQLGSWIEVLLWQANAAIRREDRMRYIQLADLAYRKIAERMKEEVVKMS